MKLFIDLTTRRFVKSAASSAALPTLVLKRRDIVPVEVSFVQRGAAVATPSGTTIRVALKSKFSDANFLALADLGTLDLYTTAVEDLFPGNTASADALLEVRWTNTGEATRTATLGIEIQNSVILGTEGAPAAVPDGKATQSDAVAGLSNEKWMTPLRTLQSIAAWIAANLSWSTLSGKPSTFPPSAHTHATSEVTGLDSALAGKAAASHTHTASEITDFAAAVSAAAPPTTNAALLTTGTLADDRLSAGVATSLAKADSALQSSALTPYRTAAAQDAIDAGKQPAGSYATITALNSAISGLSTVYTTTAAVASQITAYGYQTVAQVSSAISSALASYPTTASVSAAISALVTGVSSVAGKTGAVTLAKADVGLGNVDNTSDAAKPISTATQTALDGKAPTSHTHTLGQLTQSGAATNQVATWNGEAWVPQTPTGGGGGGLPLSESSYIIAKPGDDLAAKYTAAKALTPNGAAKSATNRAHLIIFPGTYTLTAELSIDAEYVDVIGLGAQTRNPAVLIAGNTLNVSANDVRVSGLSVGAQSFKITGDNPLQVFENCVGGASSFGGGALISTASGTFTDCSGGVDSFGGVGVASGIFANCRLTTGSFPTIYIPGKMRSCLDADYNVFDADGIYDPDASSFFTTAGVTDNTAKLQLHAFVLGVKQLGLWNSMVCWPLRSSQNAGTGSTAYSLGGLGTYNGTLVNGPTWGADGVAFLRTSSQYINAPTISASPSSYLIGVVFNPSTSGTDPASITISHNGTGNADAIQIGDSSLNILTGGHRQVAGSTVISPANQTYTTGSFQFVQQGWEGATVRRFFNKSSQVTSDSGAFGGFISPLRINARGDSVSQFGNNKTTSFAFMTHGAGASATISNSIFDLYKATLGQGLGLP